ncbi:MAG: glycerol-3-phosphate 1-O-acyltransferase [Clostridia bacterium]|nr:glycerol-3-phosphate 1-O-acyltransferase PlsY [Candidatus Pelethousia sp.]NCB29856.1 glycerol-3-phosphate 1-O-acyltransferase [Clostridia bacterium]
MYIEPIKVYVICLVLGYLLGNVQFAVIFSHLLHRDDVRRHGSGNAGSTNMLRVFGLKSGALTFVGDFLKGAAAVLIGRSLGGNPGSYAMAFGVVLGHDFPVFFSFKGGKGVASSLGVAWLINPLFGAISTVAGLGMVFYSKMVSVGSMFGTTVFLLLALCFGADMGQRILALLLWAFVILRHAENISRIRSGQEAKISLGKKKQ